MPLFQPPKCNTTTRLAFAMTRFSREVDVLQGILFRFGLTNDLAVAFPPGKKSLSHLPKKISFDPSKHYDLHAFQGRWDGRAAEKAIPGCKKLVMLSDPIVNFEEVYDRAGLKRIFKMSIDDFATKAIYNKSIKNIRMKTGMSSQASFRICLLCTPSV